MISKISLFDSSDWHSSVANTSQVRFVNALPSRLRSLVLAVEDVAYGGDVGFAIGCALAEVTAAGSALTAQRAAVTALEVEIGIDRGR
jgi:type IV secretory pathway TrbL component